MKQKVFTITDWIHQILSLYIEEGDFCVDATAGKGKDTLYLCEQTGKKGKVLAFDVQEEAIAAAKERIIQDGYEENVQFVLGGHETMDLYAKEESAAAILFNLGYLPGGNHQIATKKETTLLALEKSRKILKREGILCVCIYSGGDTGFEEKDAVMEWVKNLPAKEYDVIACPFVNKPNNPPMPVFIRKR